MPLGVDARGPPKVNLMELNRYFVVKKQGITHADRKASDSVKETDAWMLNFLVLSQLSPGVEETKESEGIHREYSMFRPLKSSSGGECGMCAWYALK